MPKTSRPDPTVANELRERVLSRFPELAKNPIPGVWFTGSNIWTALLGEDAPEGADWDIVVCDAGSPRTGQMFAGQPMIEWSAKSFDNGDMLIKRLGLDKIERVLTSEKHGPAGKSKYGEKDPNWGPAGWCYRTSRGEIDVWHVATGQLLDALRGYPTKSHAHCRAAFSLTDGLVALPNEFASEIYDAVRYPPQPADIRYTIGRPTWHGIAGAVILGALLALVIAAIAGCAGEVTCTASYTSVPTIAPDGRTVAQQADSVVEVERSCINGTIRASGAVIRDSVVLTAHHVVRCDDGTLGAIRVSWPERRGEVAASVGWTDADHDLALVRADGIASPHPVALAGTYVGQTVCVEPAKPRRERSCGSVLGRRAWPAPNGEIDTELGASVIPGNSGSAVYNAVGHLVGVATNGCYPDRQCHGWASSVIGRVP